MINWKDLKDIDYSDMLQAGALVLKMYDVTTPKTEEEYLEYKRCIREILDILSYGYNDEWSDDDGI